MKLNPFGRIARKLRAQYDLSLKDMATAMGISSPYLSALEYGEKKLSEKLIQNAVDFFRQHGAKPQELDQLRDEGEKSKTSLSTERLSNDAKVLVAAFARRLQEGKQPTPDIEAWALSKFGE